MDQAKYVLVGPAHPSVLAADLPGGGDVRFAIGLESDDVTLVLKLGVSTRQDGRTIQIVKLPT